jgi:predicted RNA-binding Zn-ribbon protein involved in translation (DUF1610 family)
MSHRNRFSPGFHCTGSNREVTVAGRLECPDCGKTVATRRRDGYLVLQLHTPKD